MFCSKMTTTLRLSWLIEKQNGIYTRKVRSLRDEGSALIRLADAVCGLAWGAAEGNKESL